MKFEARGTFETETLIDVVQRLVAQLQDADVGHVAGVAVYLTVLDRKGVPCPLLLDGETVDRIALDCTDIALAETAPRLAVGRPDQKPKQRANLKRRPRS